MKSTILLTIAIFLLSAPTPDSKAISEMSAGFLLPNHNTGLLASEDTIKAPAKDDELTRQSVQSEFDTIDSPE
jgi:hypothetical protein